MAQGTGSLFSNTVYALSDAATQFSKAAQKVCPCGKLLGSLGRNHSLRKLTYGIDGVLLGCVSKRPTIHVTIYSKYGSSQGTQEFPVHVGCNILIRDSISIPWSLIYICKGIVALTFNEQAAAKIDEHRRGITSQSEGLISEVLEVCTYLLLPFTCTNNLTAFLRPAQSFNAWSMNYSLDLFIFLINYFYALH